MSDLQDHCATILAFTLISALIASKKNVHFQAVVVFQLKSNNNFGKNLGMMRAMKAKQLL